MTSLVSKDEDLRKSVPKVGADILKLMGSSSGSRISVFDVAAGLQKKDGISVRSMYYGIIFLYSLGIVDFVPPYLVRNAAD